MSMQDPVSDMLTCIRNAQHIGNTKVRLPFSTLKAKILQVLLDEGYIESFAEATDANKRYLNVIVKYYQGRPVIDKIKRISRPGLRVYQGYNDLPKIRGGLGIAIISTSQGIMTDKTARAQQLGGEVLCSVE